MDVTTRRAHPSDNFPILFQKKTEALLGQIILASINAALLLATLIVLIQSRANRVRNYLTHKGGIGPKRIKIIDAGYHEEWLIELYVAPPNAPPLTKAIFANYDGHLRPDQVSILGNCSGLFRKH